MKKLVQIMGCAAALALGSIELAGCAAPPPPPTARKQITNAEEAIESGNTLMRLRQFELAVVEYDKALSEIRSAEGFATGNEASRLSVLKDEARSKKVTSEFEAKRKASEAAVRVRAPASSPNGGPTVDADTAARRIEQAKDAELAANKKDALDAINKAPKSAKKVDEPEDAGDVAAAKNKEPKPGASGDPAAAPEAKEPLKDKNGIFANINDNTPPLVIAKLTRIGKFVLAYCQIYNKTNDGKRVTIYNYFKDNDNQIVVPQLTTAAFPYDRFSAKVKDLIGDQSVNNIAPNSEELAGGSYLQFVSVGECSNEANAQRVVKLYLDVRFSDGTKVDLTGPEGGAANMVVPKFSIPK